jgi:hypothetical protein
MADEWYGTLQHEFNAHEGSFLLQLRTELVWDKVAFSRLTAAMLECCKAYDISADPPSTHWPGSPYYEASIPRWLAEGFWYLSSFVRDHTSHPAWREKIAREPDYYDQAYERLADLAYWFFTGQSLYLDGDKSYVPM